MVHEFPGRFDGKVVLITGGVSGIGAAMSRRYVVEGAKVVVADFCDETKGQEFVSQFKDQCYFHRCDVSKPSEAAALVAETIRHFGDLDIVHNNAGTGFLGAVTELPPEEWSRVFRVNVDGPFHICRAAITYMKTKRQKTIRGTIINTISTAGMIGDPQLACYSASKAALANLTRSMAADHALDGIRINGVAPGNTKTPMSSAIRDNPDWYARHAAAAPMNRFAEPEELAAAMMFLASDDASFITGHILIVDGGLLSTSRLPKMTEDPGVSYRTHPSQTVVTSNALLR